MPQVPRPPHAPDEPTERAGQALPASKERSAGRGKALKESSVARGKALKESSVARGKVLKEPSVARGKALKEPSVGRGKALKEPSVGRGKALKEPSVGRGKALKEPSVGRGKALKEASVGRGRALKEASVGRGQALKDSSVGRGKALKDSSVGRGKALKEPSVSRGKALMESSVGRGKALKEPSVGRGKALKESSFARGKALKESSVGRGKALKESSVARGRALQEQGVGRGKALKESSVGRGKALKEPSVARGGALGDMRGQSFDEPSGAVRLGAAPPQPTSERLKLRPALAPTGALAEATAGSGEALKLSTGDEDTARGKAIRESAAQARTAEARRIASLAAAAGTLSPRPSSSGLRRVDTQDETGPEQPEPEVSESSQTTDDDEPFSGEDQSGLPGAPPDADAAATRALAVGALLVRGQHEARPKNASEVRQVQGWVDAFGLYAGFGAGAFELFDAPHGTWTAEDRAAVAWLTEELRLLLWALGLEPALPSTFERSDAKAVLAKVPLLDPPHAFVDKARLRELDELERVRAFYDVVSEAAKVEAWARGVLEEPEQLDALDEELEVLLEAAADEGFDLSATEKAHGKAQAVATGLRAWSRQLLASLFEAGSPHAALAFDPGALEAMSEQKLANALAITHTRAGALEWLTEGEDWDLDGDAAPDESEGDGAGADDEDG